ncbi:hypothetical protein JZ751_021800, partial [Albula glossodonta]
MYSFLVSSAEGYLLCVNRNAHQEANLGERYKLQRHLTLLSKTYPGRRQFQTPEFFGPFGIPYYQHPHSNCEQSAQVRFTGAALMHTFEQQYDVPLVTESKAGGLREACCSGSSNSRPNAGRHRGACSRDSVPTDCRTATTDPAATPPPLAIAADDIIVEAREPAATPPAVKPKAPTAAGTPTTANPACDTRGLPITPYFSTT